MRIFRIENDDRVGFIWGKMKYHLPYELEYDYIRDDIKDKNGIIDLVGDITIKDTVCIIYQFLHK